MRPVRLRRERGIALLALVAVIALGSSWYLVSRLNNSSGAAAAAARAHNAEVLDRAKMALIGYVAAQANKAGENRPGALPCPEAPGNFNDSSNEGTVAYPCTLPVVGRLPWRSLGLDKLVDASGEPLWYVVATGWAGANTVINSNCASASSGLACATGRLTVDGTADDVIALIIAPGPAMKVSASTGCAAISQSRPTTGTPDWRNYLECENATYPTPDASFVTTGPSASFNDQVVKVTVGDVLPAIEAAIASRIEREIAPLLPAAYAGTGWGFGASVHKFPWAANFANPSTSAMQGNSGTTAGHLPLAYAETYPGSGVLCTSGASAPRCQPSFVAWASSNMFGSSQTYSESCSTTPTQVSCTFHYRDCVWGPPWCSWTTSVGFTVNATANNVGMALRQLSTSTTGMTNVTSVSSLSAVLNSNGSATMALTGIASVSGSDPWVSDSTCGLTSWPDDSIYNCRRRTLSLPITVFADHTMLDTRSSGASTSWFLRNGWHELTYYAMAAGFAPNAAGACTTGSTCLSVANVTPASAQHAILILAGRSLNGSTRPSSTLADYLEFGNASASYEKQTIAVPSRTALTDTGSGSAYSVPVTSLQAGATLEFRASSTNSGASTLTTPATGTLPIVDASGNALTANAIRSGSAVQVAYETTRFRLAKRPFNDRIVVVGHN